MESYTLVRWLNQGGMATIDLVERTRDRTTLARKSILRQPVDEEEEWNKIRKRFLREIRILSKIEHPNVVKILDFKDEGDCLWYIMPYYKNGSLRNSMIEHRGDLKKSIATFRELANVLVFLHSLDNPVIHRDLNPNNVLLDHNDKFILSDFGISVTLQRKTTIISTTQGWGTVGYTAPEQWTDMANADQRADVYSLGVILHELFTGQLPLGKVSDNFPQEYRSFISRLIRQDRDERTPTIVNAIRHLDVIERHWQDEVVPRESISKAIILARKHQEAIPTHSADQILTTVLAYQDDFSASNELYMAMSENALSGLLDKMTDKFLEATRVFITQMPDTAMPFEYCDPVARRLVWIFHNIRDPDLMALAFAKLISIGEGHNRFYVMNTYHQLAIDATRDNEVAAITRGLRLSSDTIDSDRLRSIAKGAKDPAVSEEALLILDRT